MKLIRRNKINKILHSKTEGGVQAFNNYLDDDIPMAQKAKSALRQLSIGDSPVEHFDLDNWTNFKDVPLNRPVIETAKVPVKQVCESPLNSKQSNTPLIKRMFMNRKALYYVKNPSKKFQTLRRDDKRRNKSYSSIKIDYSQIQKDKRIHSFKRQSRDLEQMLIKFSKGAQNKTWYGKGSSWEDDFKRGSSVKRMTIEHKEYQQCSINELYFLNGKKNSKDRAHTFGVLENWEGQQKVPKLEVKNPQINDKKRSSLICSMLRLQTKKITDKVKFQKRRAKLASQKGCLL